MDKKSYQDHFFRKAKIEGYRSRSAFKLIELDNKFKFLKVCFNQIISYILKRQVSFINYFININSYLI